ncbi:glycosyltransferase family 9 protein [Thermodesulfobacteriota bacterium]
MKVLIIRAGALGDTIMLMPSIVQLRRNVEIVLAGRNPGIDYLKPYVNECIDYERSGWHILFMKEPEKDHDPSVPEVDQVIAFLSDSEGKVTENLRIRLPNTQIDIFPPFPPKKERVHIALYMAQSLQKTGLPIDAKRAIEEAYKKPLFSNHNSPMERGGIVLHPGSGSPKKNYSSDLWLEIIKRLMSEYPKKPGRITLLLGPAEKDSLSFFREGLHERNVDLVFYPEREDLLSLLSQTPLYIGHDSGITHLAAMLGKNVIALFKQSSIHQWRPLGPVVKIMIGEKGRSDFIGNIIDKGIEFLD